jgi:hypothetical protein
MQNQDREICTKRKFKSFKKIAKKVWGTAASERGDYDSAGLPNGLRPTGLQIE